MTDLASVPTSPATHASNLPTRQKTVMGYVCAGYTSEQIILDTLLSPSTFGRTMRAVRTRLGVADRVQCAPWCALAGIADLAHVRTQRLRDRRLAPEHPWVLSHLAIAGVDSAGLAVRLGCGLDAAQRARAAAVAGIGGRTWPHAVVIDGHIRLGDLLPGLPDSLWPPAGAPARTGSVATAAAAEIPARLVPDIIHTYHNPDYHDPLRIIYDRHGIAGAVVEALIDSEGLARRRDIRAARRADRNPVPGLKAAS